MAQTGQRSERVIDLCAGIGALTYGLIYAFPWAPPRDIVAVEYNPAYIEIGKRLFPNVTWIRGDVFNLDLLRRLGRFDLAVSNPPFGRIRGLDKETAGWLSYWGVADLMVAEITLRVAELGGAMILPQGSSPYALSGGYNPYHRSRNYKRWQKKLPGAQITDLGSVDTSMYSSFRSTKISVELVSVDWEIGCEQRLPGDVVEVEPVVEETPKVEWQPDTQDLAEYGEWELHLTTGMLDKRSSAFYYALRQVTRPGTLRLALQHVNGDQKRRDLLEQQLTELMPAG